MKIYKLLNKSSSILSKKNKKTAFNESEMLLLSIINKSRDYLYRNFNNDIDLKIAKKFLNKIKKREKGYPIQYLMGYEIFYNRKFFIKKGVFIPRPETETLIEAIKKLNLKQKITCIDIGCGSGCIGITAKLEIPNIQKIIFIDNDKNAVHITRKNIKLYNIKSKIIYNSFFKYILKNKEKYNIAICNPPYISDKIFKNLQKEVQYEPKRALLAKNNGYDFYIKLSTIGQRFLKSGGYIILEAGDNMANNIKKIFSVEWNFIFSVKDFNDFERALVFQLRY